MSKENYKFFEFLDYYNQPLVNEVTYPHCPAGEEFPYCFLVYAKNEEEAFRIGLDYAVEERPLRKFYGTYKGVSYHGDILCAV